MDLMIMSKYKGHKVQRGGAYVVKAAESPSSRADGKTGSWARKNSVSGSFASTPSASDKRLAQAVIRHKSR